MKANLLTTIALLTAFAVPSIADTPNRTTMSFEEFVNASGCVLVDIGGNAQNLQAADGGNCPFAVTQAFVGGYHKTVATTGADGVFGTADDGVAQVSDN